MKKRIFILIIFCMIFIGLVYATNPNGSKMLGNFYPANDSYLSTTNTIINFTFNHTTNNNYTIMLFASDDKNKLDLANGLVYVKQNVSNGTLVSYNLTALPTQTDEEGLVALWHFDNRSEYGENLTRFYNFAGVGSNGTCNATANQCPTFNATGGKFAGAMQFDGINDGIGVDYAQNLNFTQTGQFSFTGWFKTSYIPGTDLTINPILSIGDDLWVRGSSLGLDGYGKMAAFLVNGSFNFYTSENIYADGLWHNFVVNFDISNNFSMYVDSELVVFVDSVPQIYNESGFSSTNYLKIGYLRTTFSPVFFNGSIDEFAIYNRTLSAEEIANKYSLGEGKYYWQVNATNVTNSALSSVNEFSFCNSSSKNPISGEDCSYRGIREYTADSNGQKKYYWLELPDNYNSSKEYPLVVYLHGAGGSHLQYNILEGLGPNVGNINLVSLARENDWIVVAPDMGFTLMNATGRSDLSQILNIVESEFLINSSRRHMYGLSMGSGNSAFYIRHYPTYFASIAIFEGITNASQYYYEASESNQQHFRNAYRGMPNESEEYANNSAIGNEYYLSNTPIMIIHGDEDTFVNVSHARNLNRSLSELGYVVEYIEMEGIGHLNFSEVLGDNDERMYDFFSTYTLIDRSKPFVTLNANSGNSNSINFNCSVSDFFGIENVSLYGNWGSGWSNKQTSFSKLNNLDYIFTENIANGVYSWNCYACDNSSNCNFDSVNKTITVNVPPVVEESPVTEITSGGSLSYSVGSGDLQQGYTKLMGRSWRLNFYVGDESHQLRLNSIDTESQTANITVLSTPQNRVISVGEEWKINLNEDNYYDLFVRLENVTSIRAGIFIQEINEEINKITDKE